MLFHPTHGYYSAGDWLWSILSTALFIGLLVAAIVLLVRVFSGARGGGGGPVARSVGVPPWYGPGPTGARPAWRTAEAEGAERILAERYARGEISEEEYRARLDVLRQAASGWAQHGPQPQPGAELRPETQPESQPGRQEAQPIRQPVSQERTEEVK